MQAVLQRRFAEQLTIAQVAKEVGLSRYHAGRVFKLAFGVTPREYLLHVRVMHACRLLAIGRRVSHVAQETGFHDQSHLTRHFKHLVGCTPGAYLAAALSTATNAGRHDASRDVPGDRHP